MTREDGIRGTARRLLLSMLSGPWTGEAVPEGWVAREVLRRACSPSTGAAAAHDPDLGLWTLRTRDRAAILACADLAAAEVASLELVREVMSS